MEKVILYYKFAPLSDPEAIRQWQKTLCEMLNLKGRILIADHGINGTLGGDIADLKSYIKHFKLHPALCDTEFKWSEGRRDDFPKLVVKVRPEIVTFRAREEIKIDNKGIRGGGKRLKPAEVHDLLKKRGDEVVFFDGRNAYEAEVGRFKNAVVPDVKNTREFKKELSKSKYNSIKDRPVVTYCTGGIRCEVLTVLMKNRGFKEVYQIDGGIVKYGEKYKDKGLWEGSLYVFDDRMTTRFSEQAKIISNCSRCNKSSDNFENCANKKCNRLILLCDDCSRQEYCSDCLASSKDVKPATLPNTGR